MDGTCKTCRCFDSVDSFSNVRSGTLLVTPHIRLKPRPFQHFLVKMRAWWGCVAPSPITETENEQTQDLDP